MLQRFKNWLATSPVASFCKVILGAALGAILSYVTTAEVHPAVVAVCSAFIPVILNWLNSSDTRYGRGAVKGGE